MAEKYYTQVENTLINSLMQLTKASHIKIMLCIVRFTHGFHRDETELSSAFIAKYTGISRRTVIRELGELEKLGFITRKANSESIIKSVCINSDICDRGDDTEDTGDSDAGDTGGSDLCDRGGSDIHDTQEINNNINKYIPNKESKETHTRKFSNALLKAVNNWSEIHNLNSKSRSVLYDIINKYASEFGDEAVAMTVNQCIAEGRGSIYFDRLKKSGHSCRNPDLEAFTWNELSM